VGDEKPPAFGLNTWRNIAFNKRAFHLQVILIGLML